jgi:hypothetical protein
MLTRATFRLLGDSVDPASILLEFPGAKTGGHRKGDEVKTRTGKVRGHHSKGVWYLESPLDPHCSVEEHIQWFVGQRKALLSAIDIGRRMGARWDIFLGLFEVVDQAGVEISVQSLQALGELSVPVGFDIYLGSDESNHLT